MVQINNCLDEARKAGEISGEDAERLAREFNRARSRASLKSDVTADAEAKAALQALLKAETEHARKKAKLAISSIRRIAEDLRTHKTPSGARDVASGALFLLEHNGEARFESVAGRQDAITSIAHAMMENLLYTFRRGKFGGDLTRHNRAQLPNVVRELFGENTDDLAAKGLAESWSQTAEWLRTRFNAAGGAVGKLENWGLPQRHDARALRAVGRQAWVERIGPMLDTTRMHHPLTGAEVTAGELDEVLGAIWDRVATDGWNERQPMRQAQGRGALANQHAEHRFLVFKNADAWMEYQRDFGGGSDPFAAMMGHVNLMAKDIAAMEILGPNPNTTIEWLKQLITREAQLKAAGKENRFAGGGDPLERASKYHHRIDSVWGSIRGALNTPVGGFMAGGLGGARSFITSTALGGAALTSLSDLGTQTIARQMTGLSSNMVGDYIRAMTPTGRREAVAAGLILDNAVHVFQKQARYVGTLQGPAWMGFLGDRVLTYSGLTPFTQAGKHAFGMAFLHEVAEQAGRGWADMHPTFRKTFEQFGFKETDWDSMRRRPVHTTPDGLTMLRPSDLAKFSPKLAEKYLTMVQTMTEYAVPSGGHRSRTLLLDQNQPGTVMGEIARSFAQFKSFGAAYAMLHGHQIHKRVAGKDYKGAAAYAGGLLLASTIFGAMSMQLKNVAAGKDPQPMTSAEFWAAALMQGGGFGLYGDFLFSDVNRFGGGLGLSIGGPLAERFTSFNNLTIGNMIELAQGKDTKFARELVQFARGNVPGGNIWYTRLAWERLVLDQLQYLVDPEANAAFKRSMAKTQKDFGTGFWWEKGKAGPSRAPDMGNAFSPRL